MKRISQFIAATSKELTSGKRYPSRAIVLNETTGEMRRGPGTWPEMKRYTIEVPADVQAVTVATANVADAGLAIGQTVSGRVLAAGDVVLRVAQTAPAENGLYVVGATLARHADFDSFAELAGAAVEITDGDLAGNIYLCKANRTGTIGMTAIEFQQALAGAFAPKVASIDGLALFHVYNTDGTVKVVDAATMKTFFTT